MIKIGCISRPIERTMRMTQQMRVSIQIGPASLHQTVEIQIILFGGLHRHHVQKNWVTHSEGQIQ